MKKVKASEILCMAMCVLSLTALPVSTVEAATPVMGNATVSNRCCT